MSFEIPDDICLEIVSFLPSNDIIKYNLISKQFLYVIKSYSKLSIRVKRPKSSEISLHILMKSFSEMKHLTKLDVRNLHEVEQVPNFHQLTDLNVDRCSITHYGKY